MIRRVISKEPFSGSKINKITKEPTFFHITVKAKQAAEQADNKSCSFGITAAFDSKAVAEVLSDFPLCHHKNQLKTDTVVHFLSLRVILKFTLD